MSPDGRHCLVAECDDWRYAVWDIERGKEIWFSEDDDLPSLEEWVSECGVIMTLPIPALYRLTGLLYNAPMLEHSGIRLEVGKVLTAHQEPELLLVSSATGIVEQRLSYDNFSGDWEYPIFSEDGSTIAVLTPYDVTFFRRKSALFLESKHNSSRAPSLQQPRHDQI